MVHEAAGSTRAGTPRNRAFWATATVTVVLAGALVAVLAAQGGFAAAEPKRVPQGKPLENDLLRIVPQKAVVQSTNSVGKRRYQIAILAELTSKESSVLESSEFLQFLEVTAMPGGAEGVDGELLLPRNGDARPYPWVQPRQTDTVQLHWTLRTKIDSADEVDRVRLRVLEAEYRFSFLDQEEKWDNLNDRSAGDGILPVTEQ